MLNIITHPNPILRKRSQEVTDILAPEIQKLLPEMIETMLAKDGVGLAAPQIGLNIRLITVKNKDKNIVLFNPKIKRGLSLFEWGEEGCLSVPTIFGDVKRKKNIVVEYSNEKNEKKTLVAKGMLARILQHEIDHLNGILFIDKAKKLKTIIQEDAK